MVTMLTKYLISAFTLTSLNQVLALTLNNGIKSLIGFGAGAANPGPTLMKLPRKGAYNITCYIFLTINFIYLISDSLCCVL